MAAAYPISVMYYCSRAVAGCAVAWCGVDFRYSLVVDVVTCLSLVSPYLDLRLSPFFLFFKDFFTFLFSFAYTVHDTLPVLP